MSTRQAKIKALIIILVILSNLFILNTIAYAQNIKGYNNPVLRGLNPDPSIIRVGNDFYLVTSSMYLYPGIPIYKSRD